MRLDFSPYLSADVEEILAIFDSNIGEWFADGEREDLIEMLNNHLELNESPNSHGWISIYHVGRLNGKVVAAGGFALKDELSEISWGMVHADLRGTGLGKELLQYRLDLIKTRFPEIRSVVSQTSPAAAGFFAKFGFETRYEEPKYWGNEIDLVGMELLWRGDSLYQHPSKW
jgi:[ribosomal protein S18]-alanine N-acetyltransferase